MFEEGWTMTDEAKLSGRDAYGKTLAQLGKEEDRIVVLGADTINSTRGKAFRDKFPERVFDFGIAEANMVSAAAGFAIAGKIPVAATYGFLLSMRCAEQVRTDICYPNLNVKFVTSASGLSLGTGGTTHHCTEDLAIMRSFANMTIVCPASSIETILATRACILEYEGPVYLRLMRETVEFRSENKLEFKIGMAMTLKNGKDITLIATGSPVQLALRCAEILKKEGINARVLNMHTVKPIDETAIAKATEETNGIVTIEEGTILGGLGEAVCGVVNEQRHPVRVKRIGVRDVFCDIGPTSELWKYHGLSEECIMQAVRDILGEL